MCVLTDSKQVDLRSQPSQSLYNSQVVATLKPTKNRDISNGPGGEGSTTPSPAPMDTAEGQGEKEQFCFLTSHFESLAEPEHARERCVYM